MKPLLRWLGLAVLVPAFLAGLVVVALADPEPFFAYHAMHGRLSWYSDQPFDAAKVQGILAKIDARLRISPLDDGAPASIFVANADWRQRLFMNVAYGAGGVNFYPLTRNVFLRDARIEQDQPIRPDGTPAEAPRTFTCSALMSVCTGASKFAEAGLLDGLDATTHHDYVDAFQRRFPKVHFVPDQAWVHGAPLVYTAGGETSGIELALHIVELYYDHDVAVKTARYMEYRGPAWQH